ncbi:hypothetical protein ACUOA5_06600, partial [Escherichia coli]
AMNKVVEQTNAFVKSIAGKDVPKDALLSQSLRFLPASLFLSALLKRNMQTELFLYGDINFTPQQI